MTYETSKGATTLEVDSVLLATGRRAVVPEGCAEAGIHLDPRGFIDVDVNFETSCPGVYAGGYVNGKCMLAHAATAQARLVTGTEVDLAVIPSVVFTIPECASVSLADESSEEEIRSVKIPYGANGKAVAAAQADGFLKLDYAPATGAVTGVHAIGAHAGELVSMGALIIGAFLTLDELTGEIILPHPTLSELLTTAARRAR